MIPKIGNNRENKLRSAFSSIPKPDIEEATGKTIKSNIQGVLSKKYGELDTRHVFDSVPNKDIAKSVARAENTIQTNIDKGLLNSNYSKKFPHLRDGLALSYAAADKGNSKAATRAREAAYTEGENNSNILPSPSPSPSKQNNGKLNGIIQNNGGKRYVGGDGVRIRSTPGITAENILGLLNKGNEVNYTGRKTSEKDGHLWAEVEYDGKKGWVAADYLKTQKPGAEKADNADASTRSEPKTGIRFKAATFQKGEPINAPNTKDNRVYYGNIWGDEVQKDLTSNDYSNEDLLGFYSAPKKPTKVDKIIMKGKDIFSITETDLSLDEKTHIAFFKALGNASSIKNKEMREVTNQLIDHFLEGDGTEFSSDVLTEAVKNHEATQRYIADFSAVLEKALNDCDGDVIKVLEPSSMAKALERNNVLLSKYSYSDVGNYADGLTFSIHGWTENEVNLQNFSISDDGNYSGELEFTFKDNFGLDDDDLPPEYAIIPGFKSWFILQHSKKYEGKYKPFKTVVKLTSPISGRIEGYKND